MSQSPPTVTCSPAALRMLMSNLPVSAPTTVVSNSKLELPCQEIVRGLPGLTIVEPSNKVFSRNVASEMGICTRSAPVWVAFWRNDKIRGTVNTPRQGKVGTTWVYCQLLIQPTAIASLFGVLLYVCTV